MAGGGIHRRRAASLVLVAVGMVAFAGFAALAIDAGYLYVIRCELQRTADAAALAGASAYAGVSPLLQPDEVACRIYECQTRAAEFARKNQVARSPISLASLDIDVGHLTNPWDRSAAFDRSDPGLFNAVRVRACKTDDSSNGPVPLFFACIFGHSYANVGATATAVLDDHFKGLATPGQDEGEAPLIPFAMGEADWERLVVDRQGPDDWGYEADGTPMLVSDGIPEVSIFPSSLAPGQRDYDAADILPGGNQPDGAGNFGLLNIGGTLGTSRIEQQIREGIHAEDMIDAVGEPFIDFFDDEGGEIVHPIEGNPGIKAGMKDALASRVGEVVGFFLFRQVTDTGSNAIFEVIGIRFGMLLEVRLHGNAPNKSAVVLQPCEYTGSGVRTDPDAPPSGGLVAKLMLVR